MRPRGSDEIPICEPGGYGLVLPFSDAEQEIPNGVRAVIYTLALGYCFLGVSIVADTFMGAIEVITSRRRQIQQKNGRFVTVRVWNDTVSNITLMALGSSAPEILLAMIDLLKKAMFSDDLGPSTIAGSAAFNLLVIIGFCMVVIPENEMRKVKEVTVFLVTLVFSLWAYVWVVIILSVITPDVVDIWEGVVTFACFPVLVLVAYLADIHGERKGRRGRQSRAYASERAVPEEAIKRACRILNAHDEVIQAAVRKCLFQYPEFANFDLTADDEDNFKRVIREYNSKSRAFRRMEATRSWTGAKRSVPKPGPIPQKKERSEVLDNTGSYSLDLFRQRSSSDYMEGAEETCSAGLRWRPVASQDTSRSNKSTASTTNVAAFVQFVAKYQSISEELDAKPVLIRRTGDPLLELSVEWSVLGYDRGPQVAVMQTGVCDMMPNDIIKAIEVRRPHVRRTGAFDEFFVRLDQVKVSSWPASAESVPPVKVGVNVETQVAVVPPGSRGKLAFSHERLTVQGAEQAQSVPLLILRRGGCSGDVACSYHTEQLTSVPGYDFVESGGVVEFSEGVTEKTIEVEILPKGLNESMDEFLVVLDGAQGGAEFDPTDDGGKESSIITVTILERKIRNSRRSLFIRWLDHQVNFDHVRLSSASWVEQVVGAMYCNGGPQEQEEADRVDWAFHLISLPWKLLFAMVPPPHLLGGWACFVFSLGFIGVLTAIIGDLAELFGCVLDVPDAVTAMTVVAMGTSMPDLFASRTAALQDVYADASICNVTGSNSVNVFLGLGMPWTVGAVYWHLTDRTDRWERTYPDIAQKVEGNKAVFVVLSANFGFSVLVFTVCSLFALGLLLLRRAAVGAELGGPFRTKVLSGCALLVLWFVFIGVSSWKVMRYDADTPEWLVVLCLAVFVPTGVFLATGLLLCRDWMQCPEDDCCAAETGSDAADADAAPAAVGLQDVPPSRFAKVTLETAALEVCLPHSGARSEDALAPSCPIAVAASSPQQGMSHTLRVPPAPASPDGGNGSPRISPRAAPPDGVCMSGGGSVEPDGTAVAAVLTIPRGRLARRVFTPIPRLQPDSQSVPMPPSYSLSSELSVRDAYCCVGRQGRCGG